MSDPAKYRTKEEVEEYRKQDPVQVVLDTIIKNKWATDEELEAINTSVKEEVDDAVQFSEDSPFPKAEDLFEDVYAHSDYPFIKN
jgi:pyruvate dehydrogenase E1 component alpha subunit